MKPEYQFEASGDYIRATSSDDEVTVRLDDDWTDGAGIEGQWEDAIQAIVIDNIEVITYDNEKFALPQADAIATLTDEHDEHGTIASDRQHAEALLLYFSTKEIIELDEEAVVLWSDSETDTDPPMTLNIALLLEAICTELSACLEAMTDAQDELRQHQAASEREFSDILARATDYADRIKSLSSAVEMRANEARTMVLSRQQIPESAFQDLTHIWPDIRILSRRPASDDPRLLLRYIEIYFDGTNPATELAGVVSVEDAAEEESPDELAELVESITETAGESVEAANDTHNMSGSADLEMSDGTDQPKTRNLTPIVKHDLTTSKIKIGDKNLPAGTEIVEINHKGTQAYFYVDLVDDSPIDSIGNKAKMHQNVATLFNGIDRGRDFLIDSAVDIQDIEVCQSVTISTEFGPLDELESFLRENDYLLHPIEEVIWEENEPLTFDVVDIEPSDSTTLRVTDTTDIEFKN